MGIAYPPTALLVFAFGFVLLLLLHFSVAASRLADQSKILAQRLALLEERQGAPARIRPPPRTRRWRRRPAPTSCATDAEGRQA